MTTPPKTAPLSASPEVPSEGVFQVVVESCVYTGSSNRFLPEHALERKARLRPAKLYKVHAPPSRPARVA